MKLPLSFATRAAGMARHDPTPATALVELTAFGSNPGALRGWTHLPADLKPGAALVVVLHGCTQTAAGYDAGTGWSTLADREGFALLFPEQVRANNPNGCFNWFGPGDVARSGGEAESIARMTEAVVVANGLDRDRVYVTGLSAGGAMAGVMLAAYPDLFAGGAIIGGLPYGCAGSVPEALARMRGQGGTDEAESIAAVRAAPGRPVARWPSVAIWHGTADATVSVANMDRTSAQWRGVHAATGAPATRTGPGWTHTAWAGADGRALVEEWRIDGMGHGVPIDPAGPDRLGRAGAYMLDIGIDSTAEIARGWGLVTGERRASVPDDAAPGPLPPRLARVASPAVASASNDRAPSGVQAVIEDALRSAGLMR